MPQIFCRIISAIPDRRKVHYPCSFSGNLAGAFRYVRLQDVFFGYEHELTDMVYGFQTEELLLDYLYEKDRIKKMFDRHDIYHPVKYGAVLYFQGRQLQIADQTAACELAKEKCVVKPWIFYKEGERVIEYGPNPYLALYYIETENRRQLEMETEKFFSEMSIRDPEGREVAYRNKIPEYEKEKKTDD
mgnify:CR=1 FL=1